MFNIQNVNDAYLVASGIDKQIGDKHASEIASLALGVLRGTSMLVIPHKPEEQLLIRMGIHSGPVIGGVQSSKCSVQR